MEGEGLPSCSMADAAAADEIPAGHYRDAVTGEIKPKRGYEKPEVEDLGDLTAVTRGGAAGTGEDGSTSV